MVKFISQGSDLETLKELYWAKSAEALWISNNCVRNKLL